MKEQEPLPPFDRIPAELKAYCQWVNWRRDQDYKVPVNPSTLGNAGVRWHNTWAPFEQAKDVATRYQLGVGFVLTEDDPYTCIDLDRCVGDGGQVDDQTRAILTLLSGYVELSPSGSGLHIWVKTNEPLNRRTSSIEIYSHTRWVSVTGRSNPLAPLEIPERTAQVEELVRRYFRDEEQEFVKPPLTLPDILIRQRLFNSKHGSFFESLYRGDTSVCYDDHSRAVIMLANQLALLTDFDPVRVKSLLYQTGLVTEKWKEQRGKATWIDYQIQDAIRYVTGRKR